VIRIFFFLFLSLFSLSIQETFSEEGARLKDFRGTNQKVALLGAYTEFLEPSLEEKVLQDLRREINRYSTSYSAASITEFKLPSNPNRTYFRPVKGEIEAAQKRFFEPVSKENEVDIVVLASIREIGEEVEIELQLYDLRIQSFSGIENQRFSLGKLKASLELLVYRVMNYIDRDGFVHPSVQGFLIPPQALEQSNLLSEDSENQDLSIKPMDLGQNLAGGPSIGGEKTPFWEKWWFWTIIGGSLITAGGLSYYFLVVDQPPKNADITFNVPVPQ